MRFFGSVAATYTFACGIAKVTLLTILLCLFESSVILEG